MEWNGFGARELSLETRETTTLRFAPTGIGDLNYALTVL